MVVRAKQTRGAGAAGVPATGSQPGATTVDPATYVPNFSRSPSQWRPAGGNVVDTLAYTQLLSDRAGRTTFIVVNTGANPVLICNSSTGQGAITLQPTASYAVDTEGELWAAMTPAGATTVDITEIYGSVPQNEMRKPMVPNQAWGLR